MNDHFNSLRYVSRHHPLAYVSLLGALLAVLLQGCGTQQANLAVGDPAPAFSLPTADGSTQTLAAYQGQPVLLYFHMAAG